MDKEIINKIQSASFIQLIDALTIATTASFYDTLKVLDVDFGKVEKIDKVSLIGALKEEINTRYESAVGTLNLSRMISM